MIFIDLWLLCNHGLWHVTQCAFLVKTGKGIVHCPEGMYSVCVCVWSAERQKIDLRAEVRRGRYRKVWEGKSTVKWITFCFLCAGGGLPKLLTFFSIPTQCCSSFYQWKFHIYFDSGTLWFMLSFFSLWWGFLDLINISIQYFCNCMQSLLYVCKLQGKIW